MPSFPNNRIADHVHLIQTRMSEMMASTAELVMNRKAIIQFGKYKGRVGCCCSVIYDANRNDSAVNVLVHPYRVKALMTPDVPRMEDLLWDHTDARSYMPVFRFEWLEDFDKRVDYRRQMS